VHEFEVSPEIAAELSQAALGRGVAPSAVAGWVTLSSSQWGGAGADAESIFDLGSVTKSCVALLAGLLNEQGELDLVAPVEFYLPELARTAVHGTPLLSLLRHDSGLSAHFRFYREAWAGRPISRSAILRKAASLVHGPRGQVVYSDLGYIFVGAVLERVTGAELDHVLARRLFAPLKLELGSARAFARLRARTFIKTEVQPSRGGVLSGTVHDDNAWVLAGMGTAGHAGLFGTLRGMLGLGRALLTAGGGQGPLSRILPVLLANPAPSGHAAGFLFARGNATSAGGLASQHTFGHLGFPGVSLWCDAERGVATALLTNRVFPRRSLPPGRVTIAELRRGVHDFLWGSADRRNPRSESR